MSIPNPYDEKYTKGCKNNQFDYNHWLHDIKIRNQEEKKLLGYRKCERCYSYEPMPWALPLCQRCQDMLKVHFPDVYEEARQENIRLWDKNFSEGKTKSYI